MESKFSQQLHQCIIDELKGVLGESGVKAVLLNTNLCRCAENPGELHRDLYAIFGNGALILEKVIVKGLFRMLNLSYEEANDFDFARCVNQARELSQNKISEASRGSNRLPSSERKARP